MYPILFSLGPFIISSFGFFLVLAFVSATFIIWKVARVYEVDEEKILDLIILTFFAGLLGSRSYFVITNWQIFEVPSKIFLINRYPGLSLWGGLILGSIVLWTLCKRAKLNFWQMADFGVVGFTLALSIGDIGCLLGGCNYGLPSNSWLAVPILGVVNKRFPLAALESVLFFLVFLSLWNQVIKFHFTGKVLAVFLVILGMLKFSLEFFRGDSQLSVFAGWISRGQVFGLISLVLGIVIFYFKSKRNLLFDLKESLIWPFSAKRREKVVLTIRKSCYNHLVDFKLQSLKLLSLSKLWLSKLRRKIHVQPTPTDFGKN